MFMSKIPQLIRTAQKWILEFDNTSPSSTTTAKFIILYSLSPLPNVPPSDLVNESGQGLTRVQIYKLSIYQL